MALTFDHVQLHAEAVRLGLIDADDDLPRHLEGKVKASLAGTAVPGPAKPQAAGRITITADGRLVIDGRPLACALPDGIVVDLRPGSSTVTCTLVAREVDVQPRNQENRP